MIATYGRRWPQCSSCADRMSTVRAPVRECLLIILNEEWEHRLYAERDLDALEAREL